MKDMSLTDFVALTASNNPVPGGGSVSALCGALSAALSEMVANLTIGNKKYPNEQENMVKIKTQASMLRDALMLDIKRDSDVFSDVMGAYRLPKETDEQKAIRTVAIQTNLKKAAEVPMEVAMKAFGILPLAQSVVQSGNSNAVTDGMVAAMLARTAVLGALLNVKINLSAIKDEDYVSKMNKKAMQMEKDCKDMETEILASVTNL